MVLRLASCAALVLSTLAWAQQPYLNLDFEISTRDRLRTWFLNGAGYELQPDFAIVRSGKASLRIREMGRVATAFGVAVSTFPIQAARGKKLRYSGWIKTENVQDGYAGLWWRVDGRSGVLSLDNMSERQVNGTNDWRQFTIERDISADGININFGVLLVGRGTAWFDGLTVELDGVPFEEGAAPEIREPFPEEVHWIKENAIPFRTPDPGNGLDDLAPLRQLVGNARVVAMGEATHGTNEFFRMKHRTLEFLATEMGFNLFAIEANMPEAYRLNEYVLNGKGDARQLLRGMYFWTWNVQEVLDMIEWMREFNASGKGRIQFTGFDMQTSTVAMDIVLDFVKEADPQYLPTADAAYFAVRNARNVQPNSQTNAAVIQRAADAARGVKEYLQSKRAALVAQSAPADVDWAIQNSRVVEQAAFVALGGPLYRDQMMAENVSWILDQNPNAKALIWAHNGHVSKSPQAMGSYLAQALNRDYLVLGFAFHSGRYNAGSPDGLLDHDASLSFPGSLEYVFLKTELPRFILDLRKASATDPATSWLFREIEVRNIGALKADGFFPTNRLTRDYDGLIFFEETRPSKLLPFN